MNVNGAVTPKVFSFTAAETCLLKSIRLTLKDEGSTTLAKFGAITALSNGLLIETTISASVTTYATILDNADLCSAFSDHQHFGSSATLSILSIVTPEGFGASTNVFKGNVNFDENILLSTNDSVTVTVRDDLSAIDVLQMGVMIMVE